ncbi:MAG: Stealth CR1 domain-containing protein [Bacteroidales bacterium]|nr:Stealth CR1 domain-containing protein [Bacteroidales bacterium]
MTDYPIDIVIPWVDGDDPVLAAKRRQHLTGKKEEKHADVAAATRFSDLGEIFWCIDSINIFAPFIRKIFIVTDSQDPRLEEHLAARFPDGHIPVEIVDHQVIFRGYEKYLPIFNSRSIEAVIWRIPGLSEHFVLMNDDFFLAGPVKPEDFYQGDKTVCYADWRWTWLERLFRRIKRWKNRRAKATFKGSMINAVKILGGHPVFLYLAHTPRALKRSFYENFFAEHPEVLVRNLLDRFRTPRQYNSQELFYITELKAGRLKVVPTSRRLLYLKPHRGSRHVTRNLRRFDRSCNACFGCINSIDLASTEDRQRIFNWISGRLGV